MTLHTQGLYTLEQVCGFVAGNALVSFTLTDRASAHAWMADTLRRFGYTHASRADRGVLRQYLSTVTGLSRAQVTRRITQFRDGGRIADRRSTPTAPFPRRYAAEAIRLLAEVDALHGTLSGTTTRKLCERALRVHGDVRFERLARISNGHLYNLRHHTTYRTVRGSYDKTRSVRNSIGERRKPFPDGHPSYLRVDSVQPGDRDGIKGVYLVTAVDEVTQFQCICAVEKISERFLVPMLEAFPFTIRDSIVITVRSTSIVTSPRYWRSSGSNRPSHAPGRPTTTRWRRARMLRPCARIWATAIFQDDAPRW